MTLVRSFAILGLAALTAFGEQKDLRLTLRSDPRTFDPLLVADDAAETIRYLTGGVLIRINRRTQKPEPALAHSWKIADAGRTITFDLLRDVRFSDGTPFSSADVVFTLKRLMDPALKSPVADDFRSANGNAQVKAISPVRVTVTFPVPVPAFERLFDQIPIMSGTSPLKERAVLGPFMLADYQRGRAVVLSRNPAYWKRDAGGRALPYLDRIHFDIQSNRDMEALRFGRGEIHMVTGLDAETFDRLRTQADKSVIDAGATDESEFLWFNQVPNAPVPVHKRAWFQSRAFRKAVSLAVNRADMVRLVYGGHAVPAAGPVSPSNKAWFNSRIKPDAFVPREALRLLSAEGFRLQGTTLYDRQGHPVEFSIVTNAGNKARGRLAALIQQDLARIGIKVTITPLEFGSLLDRIAKTFAYDACLLGLVNVDPDPVGHMSVWLSSGANHQWNPSQPKPATDWEAEIDRLMRAQSATTAYGKRKECFDRVQEIVADQVPMVYLISKNALVAVQPALTNVDASPFRPQLLWNADRIRWTR